MRTLRLCDGTTVTLPVVSAGPSGVIAGEYDARRLYLYHGIHGTYYLVPQIFTETDRPALEEKIQRPRLFSA